MDFKKYIPEIEKKIHYTFKDKGLLLQAFTRSSYCNEKRTEGQLISNEVLEFFGDSVLSTAIISILMKEKTERCEHGIYTDLKEGDFSNIKSKLSDKRNLSKSMRELGLQKYLRMSEGDMKLGIENEPSVMEDLFESIIGAVYIDCGMNISTVMNTVRAMLDASVYYSNGEPPIQSFKNALQEWCADKKRRLPAPVYKTVSESGPDHKRTFERAVMIGDRIVAVGVGKNQKIADSCAAEAALEVLKREVMTNAQVSRDSLLALRELLAKNKQPSPEFRDLGETERSNSYSREFIIECRAMGASAKGVANSKQDARAVAAAELLKLLEGDKPEKGQRIKARAKGQKQKDRAVKNTANAKKSDKVASPKKAPHQHKKHL